MSRRLTALLVGLAGFVWTAPAFAQTYYVSPGGSDSAAGTAPGSAWKTVGKANAAALQPGDTVLFEGGATFTDATLSPGRSGSPGSPITFSSYGSGRATIANANGAVWFSGKNWLVFDHLRLTAATSSGNVFSGSGSGVSSHITLADSVVTATTGVGVIAPNAADDNWTIRSNTITGTGDSGVIMLGGPHTITRNTISDTGSNTAITWGKHGIYSKGPDQTISYNDFSNNLYGQSISIRFHGARVFGNTIHDTPAAIGFFDYDTGSPPQGTSYVYGNRAWNLKDYGFYYDGQTTPSGRAPSVDFVVASNTFQFSNASAEAINVSPSGSAQVTVVNNVLTGTYGNTLRKAPTTVEHHNLFFGGTGSTPAGAGDLLVSPNLTASPDFAPNPGSPVVDAGVTSVAGIAYSSTCDGTVLSYCGPAPDIGAVETAVVGAVPLAPPTGLVAGAVAQTSLTLSWSASGDPRVGGYDVLRNGTVVGTSALPIVTVSGLACGTSYTFSVRATGSAATSSAVSTWASTSPCASGGSTTPASPSGGGGSGRGGVQPELTVSMSFGPQPAAVGDQFDYAVLLLNNSIQGADQTVLTVNLPAGVDLVATKATRGPGCATAGRTVTCNLDFFPGKLSDTVRITVKVTRKTNLTATASVWTMPADSNPANNTASSTASFGGAQTLGGFTTPAAGKTPSSSTTPTRSRTVPPNGTTVKPRFLVVAKAPKSVKSVAFVLDGRSACVDRAAPFTCALKARPGWHSVRVHPIGGPATTVRLRVVA